MQPRISHPASGKTFTLREASELIPHLNYVIPRLQADYEQLEDLVGSEVMRDPDSLLVALLQDETARDLAENMCLRIEELEALGVLFQEAELGLVAFPSILEGEEVLLTWQYGETRIEWFQPPGAHPEARERLPFFSEPARYN